jgi:hypothetical protein
MRHDHIRHGKIAAPRTAQGIRTLRSDVYCALTLRAVIASSSAHLSAELRDIAQLLSSISRFTEMARFAAREKFQRIVPRIRKNRAV